MRSREEVRLDSALFDNLFEDGRRSGLLGRVSESTDPARVDNAGGNGNGGGEERRPLENEGFDDGNSFVLLQRIDELLEPLNQNLGFDQLVPRIDLPFAPPIMMPLPTAAPIPTAPPVPTSPPSGGPGDPVPVPPHVATLTGSSTTEGGNLIHTVTLDRAPTLSALFPFTLTGDSATSTDFGTPTFSDGVTLDNGILTVPVGVTSFTITVPTTDDTAYEGDETIVISLDGKTSIGTIVDNDPAPPPPPPPSPPPAPTVQGITDAQIPEGGSLVHTVTLSGASATATTFAFGLAGDTAGSDDFGTPVFSNGVVLLGGVLTVPAGVTSFTVSYPTTNDSIAEGDETVGLTVGGVSAVGTIVEDDVSRIAAITSDQVVEGGTLVHTVTLTNASTSAGTYAFTLGGNTAQANDFGAPVFSNGVTLAGGVVVVPAGVTSFTVSYPTSNDTVFEGNETVDVSVGGVSAVGTIVENDGTPAIASITSDQVTEGGTLVHSVTLT
ncbi:hypothetical protein, partial [Caenimonas sp. SL110]|uniref:hypothetical protein n=1 Tax=Caenimonas sp. SL110 TaxID=1450524 RepID=UPI00193108DE